MQLLSVFIRVQFNNDTALIATIAEAWMLEHILSAGKFRLTSISIKKTS